MNRPNLSRCPAPTRTEWGTLRCVVTRGRCTHASHTRWNLVLWPMALVWAVRPWWPNAKGRAADRAGQGRPLNPDLERSLGDWAGRSVYAEQIQEQSAAVAKLRRRIAELRDQVRGLRDDEGDEPR